MGRNLAGSQRCASLAFGVIRSLRFAVIGCKRRKPKVRGQTKEDRGQRKDFGLWIADVGCENRTMVYRSPFTFYDFYDLNGFNDLSHLILVNRYKINSYKLLSTLQKIL